MKEKRYLINLLWENTENVIYSYCVKENGSGLGHLMRKSVSETVSEISTTTFRLLK